jgi:hypothetical protein
MSTVDADWLPLLLALLERFPHLGAVADVASMTTAERWALLRHLQTLARRANDTEP